MVYALILSKQMDVLILIITFVADVLQIILFFKVWGMTNDVDKIQKHLLSPDNDEYMKYLRLYTKDNFGKNKLEFLKGFFTLKDGVSVYSSDCGSTNYEWIEDYKFMISGYTDLCGPDYQIAPRRLRFKFIAECNGNPRLKNSWTIKLSDEGNEVPDELKA